MNHQAICKNIAKYRKEKKMTQDDLAERIGVSPQAVSKWENGVSCPDIAYLPEIAEVLGVDINALFREEEEEPETYLVEDHQKKDPAKMLFRIKVLSSDGDKVRVNLPLPLLKMMMNTGASMQLGDTDLSSLRNIDWDSLFAMIDNGVMGKLVEVESGDGDFVEIYVE